MLINFAKEVYLNVSESDIRNSSAFNTLKNKITFYNQASEGDNLVFIPKYFRSKKDVVDSFIDDVAKSSQ